MGNRSSSVGDGLSHSSSIRNLGATDDGSATLSLNVAVRMYGNSYSSVRIYNNGYLSLGTGYTGGFTPRPFPMSTGRVMIAPYWADVDTRTGSGRVYYKESTDSTLRSRAKWLIEEVHGETFTPTSLVIVTWKTVGYYRQHLDKLNTFQCVLASDSSRTFVIFLYGSLEWTTGDASGGSNGLGGTVARAGINAGDGARSITIRASGNQQAMLDLVDRSNIDECGIFVLSDRADLYPIGSSNLGAVDDGQRTVSFQFPFYGSARSTAYVCNNGIISLSSYCYYTPRTFPLSSIGIIAPYWADVDANVGPGRTYYQVTTDTGVLQRIKFEVEATQNTAFTPTRALIVTWYKVGYYNNHQDKLNTFQCVVATDGSKTYTIFLYDDITWTTGDASGGSNGLGGTVARAGLNAGDGSRSVTITGSGNQAAMLSIESATNVRIPGMIILRAHPVAMSAVLEMQDEEAFEMQEPKVFDKEAFEMQEPKLFDKEAFEMQEPKLFEEAFEMQEPKMQETEPFDAFKQEEWK